MNPLQSGTPSSALAPQSYRNSSQNSSFQDTFNIQNTTSTSNRLLLSVPSPTSKLRVDTGQNTAVLSVSKLSKPQTPEGVSSINGSMPAVLAVLIVLFVSAGLAIFFIQKFKRYSTPQNQ